MKESIELIICLAIYLAVGWKILLKAFRNIARGEVFDENFLMCVASIGSFIMGEYSEAVMVILLYRIGEYFQSRAVDRSRKSIAQLVDLRSEYVELQTEDGQIIKTDPEEVSVGSIIAVSPGEKVPIDGTVLSGSSRLDTAAITGEALPQSVGEGSSVISGTVNLDALLKIRTTREYSDSTAVRILELVEESAENKAQAENFITRFAKWYTPIVCALALLVVVLGGLVTKDWKEWAYRGLTFLVISCPCALVISIPLGFFAGIGGASSKGILIKGGNYLEALAKAKTVVFDKTGTLTKGDFTVVAIHPQKISEERLLEYAALAESFSDHPISRSLADAYGKKIDKSRVRDSRETPGEGICATVDDAVIAAGNSKLMKSMGIDYRECHIHGTAVHVAVDGEYFGHIIISDSIKPDSKAAVKALSEEGVENIVMLTGDKATAASYAAKELGIEHYRSGLLPQEKLDYVRQYMEEAGKDETLVFVGDGINDAPVLTAADTGVAMGGMGSAAAVEAADVVLMNDKPSDVVLSIRIAKKTMGIIYQNIVGTIGIKLVVLILSFFGYSPMWLAVFADVGVCILAVCNSMRALKSPKPAA